MRNVVKRLNNIGFNIEVTSEAKDFIADKGYDVQFGARPLHRAIQKYLEDPLAEEILNMTVKNGDVVFVEFDKENSKLRFSIKQKEEQESLNA